MAEEQLAPEGELEPEDVVEEAPVEEAPEETAETPPNPIEALASEMGWAPKDQFRGDPNDWKPADEFIRAGREIQRNVSRELKDVRATVENMSRTQAAILEQQLAERTAQLEAQRLEAIEAGDVAAVNHIDGQKQQLRQNAPAAHIVTPEAQQFVERNAWYGKNADATNYAYARGDYYAKMGINDPAKQLAAVERDVKELFPELFPAPAKPPPRTAQPSRTATPTSRTKGFHDMPAEAQAVARDMVARGVIEKTDQYVANYFANERKVG